MPERVLDYCSEILAGLDNYYLCRHKDCRAYMPNSQWVKQLEYDKFRCLLCTREYISWKKSGNRMLVNKVLVTSPNGDQELATELQMGMKEHLIWFVVWENTSSAILQRRMLEWEQARHLDTSVCTVGIRSPCKESFGNGLAHAHRS